MSNSTDDFSLIKRLPPYVFNVVNEYKKVYKDLLKKKKKNPID